MQTVHMLLTKKLTLLLCLSLCMYITCSNEQATKMTIIISDEPIFSTITTDVEMEEIISAKCDIPLFLYEGPFYSGFFHPLIAFPELAFDGDEKEQFMSDWFVTETEARTILQEMYVRGFMLVRVDDLYVQDQTIGLITQKELYLPEGKKPFVLSIDDLNYYPTMKKNGTVHKLIIDEQNNLATWTKQSEKECIVSYSNEIIFLIEEMVKIYPDFSFNGARGLIGLTGYNGVFGYNTHKKTLSSYDEEVYQAQAVAEKLRKMGWEFASHSYDHDDFARISLETVKKDMKIWNAEVQSFTLDTIQFIYPYGARPRIQSDNQNQLNTQFHIFFGVGDGVYSKIINNIVLMNRINFDGVYMRSPHAKSSPFFDVSKVYQQVRK